MRCKISWSAMASPRRTGCGCARLSIPTRWSRARCRRRCREAGWPVCWGRCEANADICQSRFASLRIFMAVLAVIAIGLGVALHFEQQKLTVAQEEMAKVHRRTVAAQMEKQQNEARMRQPANASVLELSLIHISE